jgi:hypothetical protein
VAVDGARSVGVVVQRPTAGFRDFRRLLAPNCARVETARPLSRRESIVISASSCACRAERLGQHVDEQAAAD